MEVHHPHHPTHKKKWAEYLLEFFMLFIAVTLGFFAENVREGLSNREKENVIIASLKEDLIKDTTQLNYLINEYPNKSNAWIDSLHLLIESKPILENKGIVLQAIANATIWQYYSPTEVIHSLTQSTESLNLIESEKLKKQLLEYQKNEKFYTEYLKFIVNTFQQTDTAMMAITNISTYRQIVAKATIKELYITSESIPKNIYFKSNDKEIFINELRFIDHANMKINDLKTIYSMLLINEINILNIIKEEYTKIK
jgi:hypothetical protein